MKPTMKLQVSGGRITKAELKEGEILITVETSGLGEHYYLVQASMMSIKDNVFQYEPKTKKQKRFKDDLIEAIETGVKDFYRPIMDPSIKDGKIIFKSGMPPAVRHSYDWWKDAAKNAETDMYSRLGTKNEYVIFLGCLMKELEFIGIEIDEIWSMICDDSTKLGHYINSEGAKDELEKTGSRKVCKMLYDLANTFKIIQENPIEKTNGFYIASGSYQNSGEVYPLADITHVYDKKAKFDQGVGWIVIPIIL